MSFSKLICGCLLAGALATLAFQRLSFSKARQENESLCQANEELAGLRSENEGIPRLRAEHQEVEILRTANQELLKLRNEVRELRRQTAEVQQLRQENQLLASANAAGLERRPARFSEMSGYVAKETWARAGFASPEATLQTFLWALREGQFQQVAGCMGPEARPRFEREFGQKPGPERTKALQEGLGQLARMGGYRVARKDQIADDEVVLGIQAVAGGVVAKVLFQRFGNEWKLQP